MDIYYDGFFRPVCLGSRYYNIIVTIIGTNNALSDSKVSNEVNIITTYTESTNNSINNATTKYYWC